MPAPQLETSPHALTCQQHRAGPAPLALIALVTLLVGCGSRSLIPDDQGDGGPRFDTAPLTRDGAPLSDVGLPRLDGSQPSSCGPMDAIWDPAVHCGDPTPIGWAWDGGRCLGIPCACAGASCDALYPSESFCYQQRAPACLPPPACLALPYEACAAQPACQQVYYGGGCIDLDSCEPEGPMSGMLCWERGVACLPQGQPCNARGPGECDGECFWWAQQADPLCFGESDAAACCVSESYGYCATIPRPADCAPQDVGFCPLACSETVGYFWDGAFCQPISCCCVGPDCAQTYATPESCVLAQQSCTANSCTLAGGHCLYGDFAEPSCQAGYGKNWQVLADQPDACGLGVCCTPCPDPQDPQVEYISQDPASCAALDFDCQDTAWQFSNECGCGCVLE